jgi:hypothetical protein
MRGAGMRGARSAAATSGDAFGAQAAVDSADRSAPLREPLPEGASPNVFVFSEDAAGDSAGRDPLDFPRNRADPKPEFAIRPGAVDLVTKETP